MSRRASAVTMLISLAALGVAGCGGSDAPTERPKDFALSFRHADGSLPPPYHAEWGLRVDSRGAGRITYVPDYPDDDVPRYRARFTVDQEELDELYASLRDADLLEPVDEGDGGEGDSVETATVRVDGERVTIPPYDGDGDSPLEPVSERVRELVPEPIWRSFERRRDRYAVREHGDAP